MNIEKAGIEKIAHIPNRNPRQKKKARHLIYLRKRRNSAELKQEMKAERAFLELTGEEL